MSSYLCLFRPCGKMITAFISDHGSDYFPLIQLRAPPGQLQMNSWLDGQYLTFRTKILMLKMSETTSV